MRIFLKHYGWRIGLYFGLAVCLWGVSFGTPLLISWWSIFPLWLATFFATAMQFLPWGLLILLIVRDYRRRNWVDSLSYFFGLLLTLVCLSLLVVFLSSADRSDQYMAFDSVIWQNQEQVHGPLTVRVRMVEDLLAPESPLIGMNRKEVLTLLGAPDQVGSDTHMWYWLGPEESILPLQSKYLEISLEHDRVVTVRSVVRE